MAATDAGAALLPETILQFGGGRFLRSFADLFVHRANVEGQSVGHIVVLQSTESDRARQFNTQQGRYHVHVRGIEDGIIIDRVEECASVSRALSARDSWSAAIETACSPRLTTVISNTTEAGFALDPDDAADSTPPRSFPAKLLALLQERFRSGAAGVTVIPCELFERNGERLLDLLLEQAGRWNWTGPFLDWLRDECIWLDNLVDRIVSSTPPDHPLLAVDGLVTVTEPYALWAISEHPRAALFRRPAIRRTKDVAAYYLRKVRILNGAHTALVCRALPLGFETVRQALEDPRIRSWLERLLFEEIVPVLEGRVEDPALFARQGLERFSNPFLEHRLSDIALYHEQKIQIRLVPTRDEYLEKFGRRPPLLDELLTAAA